VGKVFFGLFLFLSCSFEVYAQPENKWIEPDDSSIRLDAVLVEAHQINQPLKSIPGSISVLSAEGLTISDANNMADALNTLPGITMQSGTYATNRIVIRGMGSRTPYNTNRIRSYLNGIPLTSSEGISTPEEIDLQSLGHVEIVKGPASALYGSGLGGTINLFTPLRTRSSGNLNVQYGSFNTFKVNVDGAINCHQGKIWTGINHLQTEGFRENNTYRRTSMLATGNWSKKEWQISTTFLYINAHGKIPSSIGKTIFESNPTAAAPSWKDIGGYKATQKALGGLTLTNRASPNSSNTVTFFGRYNDSYEKRPFNNLDDGSLSLGIREKFSWHIQDSDLVFGMEWLWEQYGWKLEKEGVLINQNKENRNHINLFSVVQFRPSPRWNLSFASALNYIRYRLSDGYPDNGDQSGKRDFPLLFSPRLGLNFNLSPSLTLFASAGHGFSHPSPEETLLPQGNVNPDIQPEQGIQFELGSRTSLWADRIYIDFSLYQIELKNLLTTQRLSEDLFTGINAGRSRHFGMELLLNALIFESPDFPGKLKSDLSLTWGRHRFIDFTHDGQVYDGKNLPGIPAHVIHFQLHWIPLPNLTLDLHLSQQGKQFLDDANSLGEQGYSLFNLKSTFNTRLTNSNILLFCGLNNIFNQHYASMVVVNALTVGNNEPRYYYPGLPRHAYLGLRFKF